jgi:dTMP kinase
VPNGPADNAFLRGLAGRFVVFDGPDGSGKSTQFRRLLAALCDQHVPVCEVREPGGTAVGERIRHILLDPAHTEMTLRCEMMLYMASRAQLVEEKIRPALTRGEFVLADRYVSSTLAYQGAAGGLPLDEIMAVARAACGTPGTPLACWPDLTVIFDVDEVTARSRLSPLLDRIEQRSTEFHRTVRAGYLDQARREPGRYAIVDASKCEDDVTQALMTVLRTRLITR